MNEAGYYVFKCHSSFQWSLHGIVGCITRGCSRKEPALLHKLMAVHEDLALLILHATLIISQQWLVENLWQ